uniref:Reverse transcriptase domain-containing protein n=1 Tax=Tanacetum cinerariifolium TaxID=118510 RepID=A0A6L2KWT4_TANCI|nr:reverse transcriptase domain-containing protein [Tanacetum cinerariifolium]
MKISNFQQRFDESFHEGWDRYKDLLCACPHHGFTELHQLDTFYNALNTADQDSLNAVAGGNLLERHTQDVLTIIENKSKVRNSRNKSVVSQVESCDANSKSSSEIAKLTHAVNQQMSDVTTAMTAILKQFQATPPPVSVKAVEKIYGTCGGAHSYYQCLTADGDTFPELQDNIQGYVSAAAVNYNQGNSVYRPLCMANQIRPSGFAQPNVQNNQNRFGQPQGFNRGNNFNPEQSYQAPTQQNQVIPLNELEKVKRMNEANMKAMQTQINIVKNKLRNEMKNSIQASLSNQTNEIKNMMASLFQMNSASTLGSGSSKPSPLEVVLFLMDLPFLLLPYLLIRRRMNEDPLHSNIHYPSRMLKQKQQEKDEVQIYRFWQMFKQLHVNITLADALILMPKYQKMLKALLSNKEKLQELVKIPLNENCSTVILKKLPKKLGDPGKFLIPCGFSELKCKALANLGASINLMPLSIWKKLEMILRDRDERLTLNMRHDTSSYSNQPQKESINLINVFIDSSEDFLKDLFSTNQPSGNPTFLSHPELTSPKVQNDIFDLEGSNVLPEKLLDLDSTKDLHPLLHFDVEFDPKEIEFLLYQDIDSSLKDSIDQSNLANPADNFVDSMPEMFTDEHALDYSSPLIFDEYNDDFLEVESDIENVYDDPFDSKGEKIKESKLLIDELDLPCDFLPSFEYDSFISEDFSRVDALPSTNNEDKVFNPVLEDLDPPLYELPFFKEVPRLSIRKSSRRMKNDSVKLEPHWDNNPGKLWCFSGFIERCVSLEVLKSVRPVVNANETIRFVVDRQEITYIVDMFPATLKLPVETPAHPFIAPATLKFIQPFLKIIFYAVINIVHVDYASLLCLTPSLRLEEDYHSIKDDFSLVNVYTTRNVIVKGMLIPDDLLTDNICETHEYKDYVKEFVRADTSSPRPSLKICDRHQKPISTTPPPPSDDQETYDIHKATLLSLALHKTAKIVEEQENMAAEKEKKLEEDVEKIIEDEDKESYDNEFTGYVFLDEEDFGTRLEPESHKENSETVDDDDVEENKDDKKDDDDNDD